MRPQRRKRTHSITAVGPSFSRALPGLDLLDPQAVEVAVLVRLHRRIACGQSEGCLRCVLRSQRGDLVALLGDEHDERDQNLTSMVNPSQVSTATPVVPLLPV